MEPTEQEEPTVEEAAAAEQEAEAQDEAEAPKAAEEPTASTPPDTGAVPAGDQSAETEELTEEEALAIEFGQPDRPAEVGDTIHWRENINGNLEKLRGRIDAVRIFDEETGEQIADVTVVLPNGQEAPRPSVKRLADPADPVYRWQLR